MMGIILSFLKIGLIGFGGGSALIPLIQAEIVERKKYLSNEEFTKHTIIANITPGALPPKLAAMSSPVYSLFCAYAVTLPGVIGTLLIMMLFSVLGPDAIVYIEYASIGISTFIMLLLYLYIKKVMTSARGPEVIIYFIIFIVSFILTGEQALFTTLHEIFGMGYVTPLFNISTFNLMILALFTIAFVGTSKSKLKWAVAFILGLLYALAVGKMKLFAFSLPLKIAMLVAVVASIGRDTLKVKGNKGNSNANLDKGQKYLTSIIPFLVISIIMTVLAVILSTARNGSSYQSAEGVISYMTRVLVSTFSSFGGGEAYVTVADGFFVQGGLIDNGVFYNRLVATANALPGPILPKLAAGIGYVYGEAIGGIGFGWMLAMTGLCLCTLASALVALLGISYFNRLSTSPRVLLVKKYILPVVCGMLLSTILSILAESLKTLNKVSSFSGILTFLLMVLLFSSMLFLHKRYHVKDSMLLLLGGISTLLFCVFQ